MEGRREGSYAEGVQVESGTSESQSAGRGWWDALMYTQEWGHSNGGGCVLLLPSHARTPGPVQHTAMKQGKLEDLGSGTGTTYDECVKVLQNQEVVAGAARPMQVLQHGSGTRGHSETSS